MVQTCKYTQIYFPKYTFDCQKIAFKKLVFCLNYCVNTKSLLLPPNTLETNRSD